ncbi:hypothetical protein A2999_01230 [Candidatus Wolfebacteria bacterium RIFCSPLOWO2_01_FULL_38_11]|uniref:Methyltransferase type 11 n=2 Tax=Candidatus Wolfeibacteriota TaxID=1752735 RepID=A0A0G0GAN8_9BACT|nr:MAG: Methyltransferase type 11 [Candidatus Wolfebacteria bacterium GW2011_GWC1_37_10]OGM91141.1 MAG: hypothetical protein A2999_01230 [Candidatus Wolfebacteria bacterium RIFCSPLOWO2_01_FULL_38_11]
MPAAVFGLLKNKIMNIKNFINKKFKIGADNDERRVDWVEKKLKEIPAGSRILDAGAGECRFKKFCSHLDYVAQDFREYGGSGDNKGLQTETWDTSCINITSDIYSIPEPDKSFDAILCTEVFEHIPDPILAIKEFSRLLKKRGKFILTAPFASGTHFAPFHFYSGFNRYFYETHLPRYGFKIIEIYATGSFFEYIAQEVRRMPYMARRYAHTNIRIWEYPFLVVILLILKRLNVRDNGSKEFLNFAYCIVAERQ